MKYTITTRYHIQTETGNGWTSARWYRWDDGGLTLSPVYPDIFSALCGAFTHSLKANP